MTQQPEALRLAALWEKQSHGYALTPEAKTAAELRRLHELNQELLAAVKALHRYDDMDAQEQIETTRAVSAAMAKGETK